jgi:hypothetical protein
VIAAGDDVVIFVPTVIVQKVADIILSHTSREKVLPNSADKRIGLGQCI